MSGAKAERFLQHVKQAAIGHPWYTDVPFTVNICSADAHLINYWSAVYIFVHAAVFLVRP